MQSTDIHWTVTQILVSQCILLQHLTFPIIGYKPCLHETGDPTAGYVCIKNKQVVQIRIQVSHVEGVLERWSLDQPQWIHSRPTTDCMHQGWAIKYFSVLNEMRSICGQPLYGIISMILHINKSRVLINYQNIQIFLSPFQKSPMLRNTRAAFHFPSNMTAMTQRIITGPARVEWLWVNDFSPNEYHIWHAWLSTCWHVENKSPKYEAPIFTAQLRNHWRKWKGRASVPKNWSPDWGAWILCQCQW